LLTAGPNSSSGGKAIHSWKRASGCVVEPATMPHAASSLHPFDAAGRQCAFDVVRVDIADCAFHDVGQRGDTRVGVEACIEGRALMVEKIEKDECFRISPTSDGLIKRVAGPCVRPRVRRTI